MEGVLSTKARRDKIGYLPQSFGLFKELSVYDSMKYFCNLKGIPKKQREREIERCIAAVNMEDAVGKAGGKLSGGMMRRVGVAQALLNRPQLILFDEPTAGLDPEERMRFKNIISDLGEQETVLISTHIVEDIEACCDKVIVMDQGRVLSVETCEELAAAANGKVFACERGREKELTCRYFIEKQFKRDGKIYYRLLAEGGMEAYGFEPLEATVEDGYMAAIKGL